MLYHLIPIVERLSEHRFYGLDAAEINGVSLRKIFYEYGNSELDNVVSKVDKTGRWVGAAQLRNTAEVDTEVLDRVSKLDLTGLIVEKARELLSLV